jgi:Fe-S cluster assembly protein SufD
VSGLYLKDFESFAGAATAEGVDWLEPTRRAAMDRFARTGFPSTKDEEWRFTPVTAIAQASWQPAWAREAGDGAAQITGDQLAPFVFGHTEWSTLVFVNGEYAPELSSAGSLPGGVAVTSLAEALRTGGVGADLLERHLARHART